jgi:hypothetical protein
MIVPRTHVQKKYRLMVKKRLIKVHREELGGCESKEEKQGMLAKSFDDTFDQAIQVSVETKQVTWKRSY